MVNKESRIIYFNLKHPLEVQLPGAALKEALGIDYSGTTNALQNEELYPDRYLERLLAEAEKARLRAGGHVESLRQFWRETWQAVLETLIRPPLPGIGRIPDHPQRPNHDLRKWDLLVMTISAELADRPKRRKDAEAARRWRRELEHGRS